MRRFCPGILTTYVIDEGDHFQYLAQRDLDADELTLEDLHRHGLNNLATSLQSSGLKVQPYGAIFAVMAGGNFEASTMALPSLWDHSFRSLIEGPYMVAAPARDVLAFGPVGDQQAKAELQALIDRLWPDNGDHLLSDSLYVRDQEQWKVLKD